MKIIFKSVMLKSAALSAVIFCAMSSSAQAQIGVEDVDVKAVLENIEDGVLKEIKTNGDNTNKFEDDKTIPHYEAEIARLDTMLTSLGYYEVKSDNSRESTTGRTADFYNHLDGSTPNRDALVGFAASNNVGGAYELNSLNTTAATRVGGACVGTSPEALYLCEYGFTSATDLYGQNPDLAKNTNNLYSALYLADKTVGQFHQTRQARATVYDELLREAKTAKDMREIMEAQNAILLENGRNLSLLISLQTAQLNADAAQLRKDARVSQAKSETFANTGASSLVLSALVAADATF